MTDQDLVNVAARIRQAEAALTQAIAEADAAEQVYRVKSKAVNEAARRLEALKTCLYDTAVGRECAHGPADL